MRGQTPDSLPANPKMVSVRAIMDALHIDSAHIRGTGATSEIINKVQIAQQAGIGDKISLDVVIKWVDLEIYQRSKWLGEYKQRGVKNSTTELHEDTVYYLNMAREKLSRLGEDKPS